jgi:outer membrane biosynthesis protein TonB
MKNVLIASMLLTALLFNLNSIAQNTPAKPAAATAAPAATTTAAPAPATPTATPTAAAPKAATPTAAPTPAPAKPADPKATETKAADAKGVETKTADAKAEANKEEPKKPDPAAAKKSADGKKENKKDKAGKDGEVAAETPPKKPSMKPPCPIAAFRIIGMETIDAEARREKALKWLAKNGPDCAPEKLVALRNNRAQWMGAADSTELAGAIDLLIESITDGNPDGINLLYGTAPPPPKPADDKKGPPKKK